jgi:hypothetical protein
LNQICKSYKRNKKIENEKEKRRKKYITDPGEPFGPAGETARGPFQPFPNWYP